MRLMNKFTKIFYLIIFVTVNKDVFIYDTFLNLSLNDAIPVDIPVATLSVFFQSID